MFFVFFEVLKTDRQCASAVNVTDNLVLGPSAYF
jgi:hypothetical protein